MKIFRLTIFGALLMAGATTGFGDTNFRWLSSTGTLKNKDNTNIALGNATVLTFVSNNVTVDALSFVTAGQINLLSQYNDDDFFKAEANITTPGRLITGYMPNAGDSFVSQQAYAIVLDMPYATFMTTYGGSIANIPKNGTVYAGISSPMSAPIIKVDTLPQPTTPQDFTGSVKTDLQVIPEPAGAVLLLVGGAAMLIRRRLQRG